MENAHFAGRVGTFVDVRTFGLVLTASKGCLKLVLMFGFELTLSLRLVPEWGSWEEAPGQDFVTLDYRLRYYPSITYAVIGSAVIFVLVVALLALVLHHQRKRSVLLPRAGPRGLTSPLHRTSQRRARHQRMSFPSMRNCKTPQPELCPQGPRRMSLSRRLGDSHQAAGYWTGSMLPASPLSPPKPKEERDVPTWSCSHPLLIEHLSQLVMDVRRSCSCMSINGGDTRKIERSRHIAALSVKRAQSHAQRPQGGDLRRVSRENTTRGD
ncbi:unnamed protein product [Tetraodon nigroviridis]|uniref:(spotted green pufferfish) hypothetical protein n=1 Tax=Tetraodon nigroviridis TaxID=99883 RepID=Q4SAE9_TETNG|nr:unnamed protein product [Tetraodon nigroviridis]